MYLSLQIHMDWHASNEYEEFTELNEAVLPGCVFAGYFEDADTKWNALQNASLTMELHLPNVVEKSLFGDVAEGRAAITENAAMCERLIRLCSTSQGRRDLQYAIRNLPRPKLEG